MKKDNILSPSEYKIKAETLEELKQVQFELSQLNWDELNCIWNQAQNIAQLEELITRAIEHFNFQEDEQAERLGHAFQYDIRNAGKFCYAYTSKQSEKYTEHIEVYKPSILTKFRELTQLIAYQKYNIGKEWTERDSLTLPISACDLSVQQYIS